MRNTIVCNIKCLVLLLIILHRYHIWRLEVTHQNLYPIIAKQSSFVCFLDDIIYIAQITRSSLLETCSRFAQGQFLSSQSRIFLNLISKINAILVPFLKCFLSSLVARCNLLCRHIFGEITEMVTDIYIVTFTRWSHKTKGKHAWHDLVWVRLYFWIVIIFHNKFRVWSELS